MEEVWERDGLGMRVLQFVSTLNRNSGVMRVIMNYYTHINRNDLQFDFLYFIESEDSYQPDIYALGGRTHCIPKPGVSVKAIHALCQFFRLHGSEYDWLHNHESYLTALLYPIARHYGLSKVVVHAHLTKYSDKKLSALRNYILCLPLRFLPVKKMACSKAAADFLYADTQDVYILHNMIDCAAYAYQTEQRVLLRKRFHMQEQFVIGHVGRFEKQKNHKFLIEVFAAFVQEYPDSRLLLVGSGNLESATRKLVQEKHLENAVIFAGMQKDIVAYLSAMDVFVLPSIFEGLPMVALEAQANGLPCILSDTITKETALSEQVQFCALNNIAAWKDALVKIKKKRCGERQLTAEIQKKMDLANAADQLAHYYEDQGK